MGNEQRRVVVDTNVLLTSISPRSSNHWLWQAILSGKFILFVTTDILDEYAEIIEKHMGQSVSEAALDLLTDLPNVHFIHKYYWWHLIEADPDDNKFLDCAIAASAEILVSEDKHFKEIQKFPYFGVKWVKLEEFRKMIAG